MSVIKEIALTEPLVDVVEGKVRRREVYEKVYSDVLSDTGDVFV